MTDDARRARRDDVTQIITGVLDDYNRTDAVGRGPDTVADAILAALEESGLEIVWRDAPERE